MTYNEIDWSFCEPITIEQSYKTVPMLSFLTLFSLRLATATSNKQQPHINIITNHSQHLKNSYLPSIFASLPGAGAVLAPRLLAAFGSDRDRFKSPKEVQNYSGIAPVTVQRGKKRLVRWRWACPKFIRQSFHEFAGESRKYSIWASAFYEKQVRFV
jgi:transposase